MRTSIHLGTGGGGAAGDARHARRACRCGRPSTSPAPPAPPPPCRPRAPPAAWPRCRQRPPDRLEERHLARLVGGEHRVVRQREAVVGPRPGDQPHHESRRRPAPPARRATAHPSPAIDPSPHCAAPAGVAATAGMSTRCGTDVATHRDRRAWWRGAPPSGACGPWWCSPSTAATRRLPRCGRAPSWRSTGSPTTSGPMAPTSTATTATTTSTSAATTSCATPGSR